MLVRELWKFCVSFEGENDGWKFRCLVLNYKVNLEKRGRLYIVFWIRYSYLLVYKFFKLLWCDVLVYNCIRIIVILIIVRDGLLDKWFKEK